MFQLGMDQTSDKNFGQGQSVKLGFKIQMIHILEKYFITFSQ